MMQFDRFDAKANKYIDRVLHPVPEEIAVAIRADWGMKRLARCQHEAFANPEIQDLWNLTLVSIVLGKDLKFTYSDESALELDWITEIQGYGGVGFDLDFWIELAVMIGQLRDACKDYYYEMNSYRNASQMFDIMFRYIYDFVNWESAYERDEDEIEDTPKDSI